MTKRPGERSKTKEELAKCMEITKEDAIRENKKLAETRKKTIAEQENDLDDMLEEVPPEKDPLQNPALLPLLLDELHKSIVGEDDTMIVLIIINCTRLVKDIEPTSGNLCINAASRAGKDYIAKNVYKAIMEEDIDFIHRSKISKTAFNYWHQGDQDWDWNGKQLLLEDIGSEIINSSVFKTMSSGSNKATIIIKNKAVELNVKGKPNITCTGFNIDLSQEALGRYPVIHIDESEEQTKAIKKFKSRKAKGEMESPNTEFRAGFKRLQRVHVVIPYADVLDDLLPDTVLMREIYGRFLDYIKACAAFHRYQREKDCHGKLIATYDDYLIARIVLMKTCLNIQAVSTTLKDEKVIRFVKENQPVTKTAIMDGTDVSHYYMYEGGLNKLVENGFLIETLLPVNAANRKVMHYLIATESGSFQLPLFPKGLPVDKNIKKHLMKMLDSKTVEPIVDTDTRYNSNSFMVFRYLLNKSLLYNDIYDVKPKNHKNLRYGRYFGFYDEKSMDEMLDDYVEDQKTEC